MVEDRGLNEPDESLNAIPSHEDEDVVVLDVSESDRSSVLRFQEKN